MESSGAQIGWQHFLDLYCIFEAGQVDKQHLIQFWRKFFDPKISGIVLKDDYEKLLEKLVRGNSLPKPNPTTMLFARLIQKQMREQGCLDEQGNMNIEKLIQAYEEERLDIQ